MKKIFLSLSLVLFSVVLLGAGCSSFSELQTQTPTTQTPTTATKGGISMDVVAKHNSVSSCYTVVNGSVYDVTDWINQHPGGSGAIKSMCGKDASNSFDSQHGGQRRPESELASFKIGVLAQ